MKKWKQLVMVLAFAIGLGAATFPAPQASAINVFDQCKANGASAVCKAQGDSASGMVQTVINVLLYILGIIAVIMIIVGGIRYTTSAGNSSQVKEAKDTIIYSIVGLVIAIMAFTIVNFVLKQF